jgi:hypothetical protein
VLIATGFGMQMLVHFCATSFAQLNVLNGGERGGPLTSIKEVPVKLALNSASPQKSGMQVFLDNLTGDYYIFEE